MSAAAVDLLRELSGAHGIRASASTSDNYGAVFTRDAVMAGIAGLIVDDSVIVSGFRQTLDRLRALQGLHGQIASNYEIRDGAPPRVSFGSLAPRVDSNSWYLLGIALGARKGVVDPDPFRDSVRAVVRLLDTLEYNGGGLLYVPPGGNWADEYPYEGYVLSDQTLRAWALRLVGDIYRESAWTEKSAAIGSVIEDRFNPGSGATPYPPASISPTRVYDIFDLAASSLLGVSGIAPRLAIAALEWVESRFLACGQLPPAFNPVIDEAHSDWPALRRYHRYAFRNLPHQYHNGGIWPIWLGWLALALARTGRQAALAALRVAFDARVAALPAYDFEEYLHGLTGEPGGVSRMAYSATGALLVHTADSTAAERLLAS